VKQIIIEGKIAKNPLASEGGFHLPTYKNLLFSQPLTSFKFFFKFPLVLLTITLSNHVTPKHAV
jgi:hypothetical protein